MLRMAQILRASRMKEGGTCWRRLDSWNSGGLGLESATVGQPKKGKRHPPFVDSEALMPSSEKVSTSLSHLLPLIGGAYSFKPFRRRGRKRHRLDQSDVKRVRHPIGRVNLRSTMG